MKRIIWPLILLAFLSIVGIYNFSKAPELPFKLIEKEGPLEIREYGPLVVAETVVTGERAEALDQGFRILHGYISGGNSMGEKIPMRAPVTQQLTKKGWTIRFILPEERAAADFPKPDNGRIQIKLFDRGRYALIRFSGQADDEKIKEEFKKLMDFVAEKKLDAGREPILAFYNPPWIPGFLRRNEILLPLSAGSKPN